MNPPKSAREFLNTAVTTIDTRGETYDSPNGERSMGACVIAFNAITGAAMSEAEGYLFLQILKDVRQWQKLAYHEDSALDCVAYAALKAEALKNESDRMEKKET